MLRAHSRHRENAHVNEIALIKDKLRVFGAANGNPLKDQIADLRAHHDSGVLNHTDYAVRVAALLGSPDGAADHLEGRIRAA